MVAIIKDNKKKEFEVLDYKNLIPVKINYKINEELKSIVAQVDYNSNTVVLPDDFEVEPNEFSKVFFEFVYNDASLPLDMYAVDRPETPEKPKEEDIEW